MTAWKAIMIILACVMPVVAGELNPEERIKELEQRVVLLENENRSLQNDLYRESSNLGGKIDDLREEAEMAIVALFLSGITCALWAQYTRRSAWLWFFYGLILAPIALISLVWINALGIRSGELRPWTREY